MLIDLRSTGPELARFPHGVPFRNVRVSLHCGEAGSKVHSEKLLKRVTEVTSTRDTLFCCACIPASFALDKDVRSAAARTR